MNLLSAAAENSSKRSKHASFFCENEAKFVQIYHVRYYFCGGNDTKY